ncbi:hypothetical protein Hypma_012875 [Hypsizygus marmoreus]|uniref:Ribonuclease H1 N-terminal domain-containing protein n=1 Tax=Hypsizygus marmoreus TaxID=39966 RepID=A0A369JMT2_HYPMA|nr:hypothetical protein Hypma_012875 [Hypsizygus marmoreus]
MHLSKEHVAAGPCFSSPAKARTPPRTSVKRDDDEDAAEALAALAGISLNDAFSQAKEECLWGEPAPSQPSRKRAKDKEGYVVFYGRKTGVFQTWAAADAQVSGFNGARFQGYWQLEDAIQAWNHACANDLVGPLSLLQTPPASPSPAHRGSSLASLSAKKRMSNEECFWLVVRGDHPGVYDGETAARAAVGAHTRPAVYKSTEGQAAVAILFTRKYMGSEVRCH